MEIFKLDNSTYSLVNFYRDSAWWPGETDDVVEYNSACLADNAPGSHTAGGLRQQSPASRIHVWPAAYSHQNCM